MAIKDRLGYPRAWANRHIGSLREVAPHAHHMGRKPLVVLYWIATARAGLLVLAIVVVTFPTLMPRAIDAVMAQVYEPVVEKKLFGLVKRERENPLLMPRSRQLTVVVWVIGMLVVLVLLWLHIPRAVALATDKSLAREREADNGLKSDPSQSLFLYRSALAWATKPDHESRLRIKVDSLNDRLSRFLHEASSDIVPESPLEPEQTLVLSASSAQQHAEERRVVGERGRYRIEAEIGRGAMGIVHRARDEVLDREIAIKELPEHLAGDEELMVRFQQEARALARLTHPNIVQVYDFVLAKQHAYIAMELVDGVELQTHMQNKPDDYKDALRICAQLASALSYAHGRGVIHRDFKPANVLMSADGQPKITDFGLSKVIGTGFETLAGTIIGSPAYMSPEQAMGKLLDARTDLYSFGVVLYWMITGRLPFDGSAKEMMDAHINETPVPPAEIDDSISASVNDAVVKMLAKDPSHRIETMDAVASILRDVG